MDDAPNYYQILHVSREAPPEVIRASYRALMQAMKKHPDLGGDHQNAALINAAYATLSDSEKRAAYDRTFTIRAEASGSGSASADNRPLQPRAPKTPYGSSGQAVLSCCPFCDAKHTLSTDGLDDASCLRCSSPLTPRNQYVSLTSGLRKIERFPKHQTIKLYTDWPSLGFDGRTLDISLNGMLFQTQAVLRERQTIKISCDMCQAIARVAHLARVGDAWNVGVEFVTLRFTKIQGSIVSARA
jgi:hypothetical protein